MKKKLMNKEIWEVIDSLREDLDLADDKTKAWNYKYFYDQKNRYIYTLKLIEKYFTSGKVLDIGSVPCQFLRILSKLGYDVIGLDVTPDRVEKFNKKHSLNVLKCNIDFEKIPVESNTFDLVLFLEVIEHLRINPITTLREIKRVLKPNGIMILSTPNLYALHTITRFITGRGLFDAYKEFDKLEKYGHMGHSRLYHRKELKEFLTKTGFEVLESRYVFYGYSPKICGASGVIANIIYLITPLSMKPYQIAVCKKPDR